MAKKFKPINLRAMEEFIKVHEAHVPKWVALKPGGISC